MKITIWTVACDDDNGTYAKAFGSAAEAQEWVWAQAIAPRVDAVRMATMRSNLDLPHALNAVLGEDHLDTYSIESHVMEVTNA